VGLASEVGRLSPTLSLLLFIFLAPLFGYSQSRPDLSVLNSEERTSIEYSCSHQKFSLGPAAYDRCLQAKLDEWSRDPHKPDLSVLNSEERTSIEYSCSHRKFSLGPAAYDRCLQTKLDEWSRDPHKPDLSVLNSEERTSIEYSCSHQKFSLGPAAYDRCLQTKLDEWSRDPHKPDLSVLNSEERTSIEYSCSHQKFSLGPAAYDQCLQRQLEALKSPDIPATPSSSPNLDSSQTLNISTQSTGNTLEQSQSAVVTPTYSINSKKPHIARQRELSSEKPTPRYSGNPDSRDETSDRSKSSRVYMASSPPIQRAQPSSDDDLSVIPFIVIPFMVWLLWRHFKGKVPKCPRCRRPSESTGVPCSVCAASPQTWSGRTPYQTL
jgi:hypothetical protein